MGKVEGNMAITNDGTAVQTQLEALVDAIGLVAVISELSSLCHAKVEHLAETWQETNTQQVKTWKHNAQYLDKVASHVWRQGWERP